MIATARAQLFETRPASALRNDGPRSRGARDSCRI